MGGKGLLGRRMRGVVYLVALDDQLIEIMMQDVVPEADKTLPLCEASALTLRRSPSDSSRSAPKEPRTK